MTTKVGKKKHKIKVQKQRIKKLTKENEELKVKLEKSNKDCLTALRKWDEWSNKHGKVQGLIYDSFEPIGKLEKTIIDAHKQLIGIYNHLQKKYD